MLKKIRQGVKQVVILGSGLDTRPLRLASDHVKFYEVEQKHVLQYKAEQIEQFGYHQNSQFIHADYTDVDVVAMLLERGLDPELETFFLWEGNIFYLKYENICHVLENLRQGLTRFELAFDYLSHKLICPQHGI